MLVISNNCAGGYLYNHLSREYNNPFIWTRVSYDSILAIMQNWEKIDWLNYDLEKSEYKPNSFNIVVDNSFKIHFSHYLFDPTATVVKKDQTFDRSKYDFWMGDVRYCKIWELIDEKYLARTERMLKIKEDPVFLIRDDERYVENMESRNTIESIVEADSRFKRLIITDNTRIVSNKPESKILYVKNVADHPDTHVKENLTKIKEFFNLG